MTKKKEISFDEMNFTINMNGKSINNLIAILSEVPAKHSLEMILHLTKLTNEAFENAKKK